MKIFTWSILLVITVTVGGYRFEDSPPPHEQKAKTARYIVHNTDWGVLGTISAFDNIKGRPFTNIASFCDGPMDNSTGVPYFYVMNQDITVRDVLHGSPVSLTLSEALTDYCKDSSYDPEDPRCARLTLSGKMVNVTGDERQFALNSLFSRHPQMKEWSVAHAFYPTKLVFDVIWMLDYFGEPAFIPVKDYFSVHL